MPGSDTRNSAQKATINWHPGWLGERDACGDLVGTPGMVYHGQFILDSG